MCDGSRLRGLSALARIEPFYRFGVDTTHMTTTRGLREADEPITMLTAYDALTARIIDDCGIDIVLVGDSMGTTVLGYDDTLPVTLADVKSRTAAVDRGTDNPGRRGDSRPSA